MVTMAQEGGPRINASLADPYRSSKRLFVIQGNIPESLVGADKRCRDVRQGEVLKYLRKKLLPPH